MWESAEESGAAVIYRDQTLRDRSLTSPLNSPSDLPSRIVEGAVGGIGTNSTLYGTFGSQGSIYTPVGIVGRTYTIAGEPGWGIFRLVNAMASTYTKPVGSGDAWSGTLFGDAVFGKYSPTSDGGNNYWDLGLWYADVTDGVWKNGILTGTMSGEFLTHKKLGTIAGQLLGTYDEAGNSWQTVGAGTFNKTQDVLFSSEIEGQ